MDSFPRLETETFTAFIADNSPLGIHRGMYNGVASLIPRHSGNNLFVPTYAGMNYETISLTGLPAYEGPDRCGWEPRCEPMSIESADDERVVLVQPETSHAHIAARITFSVEEPHYLHQRIELAFHRRFSGADEPNEFRSLWASYIHMPPDRHVYLKLHWQCGNDLDDWLGITKADHSATTMEVRPLPDGREIDADAHLRAMETGRRLTQEDLTRVRHAESGPLAVPRALDGPLTFYYGLCHGPQVFLMMFKQPERIRLAYSPCGGGTQPAWCPAWDYVLCLDAVQIGTPYVWDVCLVVKPYQGRADVLGEVRRYLGQ